MSNRDSMISCIASLQDQVKVCRGVSSLCPVGKHVNSAKRSGAAGAHELAAVVFTCCCWRTAARSWSRSCQDAEDRSFRVTILLYSCTM